MIINRNMYELSYTYHCPVQKPLLSITQRQQQVSFAPKYLNWP